MTLATAYGKFGQDLVRALGLQGRSIAELHIHVVGNNVVTVDIVEHLHADDGDTVTQHLSHYTLQPKGE